MISLSIYSILITITAFVLIWLLYKLENENKKLRANVLDEAENLINMCVGCSKYYEDKIKMYENQMYSDTDLINDLRKENWNLKNDRWD